MYLTHWGLERPPFPSGLDLQLFYEGASQREAFARLRFLLAHRRRLGVVLGEKGMGRSLLLRAFAEQCRGAGHAVGQLNSLGLSSREFFWQLGNELHAAVRVEDNMLRLFRQLSDLLQNNALHGKQTVLVLDDLDQAGPDLLNQVQRLLRTEAAYNGWLTVVASVPSQQLSRLGKGALELVDLRIELEPWDELDTIGYLQMALVEAGAQQPLFDDQAMAAIQRASGGVPRVVNRIAEFALLEGASRSLTIVDESTVQLASEAVISPASLV